MEGYALLIGVDKLDHTHYVSDLPIECAFNNILDLKNILLGTKLYLEENISTFCTGWENEPTWSSVKKQLIKFNKNSPLDEGFLFIYITCHTLVTDIIDGESKNQNFLAMKDRLVFENEWRELIQNIDKKFTVLIFFDTCYASGIFKFREISPLQKTYLKAIRNKDPRYINLEKRFRIQAFESNQADLGFLFSSREKNTSLGCNSGGTKRTFFTNEFINAWRALHDNCNNYFEFLQKFTLRLSVLEKPNFILVNKKNEREDANKQTIFHRNYPLIF